MRPKANCKDTTTIGLIVLFSLLELIACTKLLAQDVNTNQVEKHLPDGTATITFSGLFNGINPWTNFAELHRPMPQTYQPLLCPSPRTYPVDGGNLDVTITWDRAFVSNHGLNQNVEDHTGDNSGVHHELGGAVLFGTTHYSMTFSKPVEISSFWWTYYLPYTFGSKKGSISVYEKRDSVVPLKSVELNYSDSKGYVWHQMTNFSGTTISKIVFDPGVEGYGLNVDDMVLHVTSKPAQPKPRAKCKIHVQTNKTLRLSAHF
jgi:hypothetical protein